LIGNYLRRGAMVDGLVEASVEGTPPGGPLSPLLEPRRLRDFVG